jgi:alkylation response protein AidB-like acyl-CoA dehydrogenase
MTSRVGELEESFRLRARAWLSENMPRQSQESDWIADDTERWQNARDLQRKLFDAGFAGVCFPKAYGGQGLTPAHQRVLDEETLGYQMPTLLNVPTFGIIGATLLDFGSEAQKKRYLPAMLRGDEVWVQFLSEPTGGSDLAAVMTRATPTPDADAFLLSGSKIWSSGAYAADYAICVARTDWDVPKHQGITVFIVKVQQPGLTIERIRGVAGGDEFCQEFFDDVRIPAENVVGERGQGWSVVHGLLAHERNSMGRASPYVSGQRSAPGQGRGSDLVELLRACGVAGDPRLRQLVAEVHVLSQVMDQTAERVTAGMVSGLYSASAGALLRLMGARNGVRGADVALEIAGSGAAAWSAGDASGQAGVRFLNRQGSELGGGSSEIQRNIISERVLGMPREYAADRDVPFSQVRRNSMPSRGGGRGAAE